MALDGPASAGKSTVGKRLAAILDCPCLDTGLMYRAVTAVALDSAIALDDEPSLARLAAGMRFHLVGHSLQIDGAPASSKLHTIEVDANVSAVSAHASVRAILVDEQRRMAGNRCFVMVGRDIGTVVLPLAPVKFWITASAKERARRRAMERQTDLADGETGSLSDELDRRDAVDSTRSISPSIPATDAIFIDTDSLTLDEVVNVAVDRVARVLGILPE